MHLEAFSHLSSDSADEEDRAIRPSADVVSSSFLHNPRSLVKFEDFTLGVDYPGHSVSVHSDANGRSRDDFPSVGRSNEFVDSETIGILRVSNGPD